MAKSFQIDEEIKLPTLGQLKRLLKEKGRDALVCYAWRNAMRALPVIALGEFEQVWPKDTIRHLFAVIRANTVLFQVKRKLGQLKVGNTLKVLRVTASAAYASAASAAVADDAAYAAAVADDAAYAAAVADDAAYAAVAAADDADDAAYAAVAAADDAAYAAVAAADDADDADDAAVAAIAAYAAADAIKILGEQTFLVEKTACRDFELLQQSTDLSHNWLSVDLWHKQKPSQISASEAKFLNQLIELGLDFVAEDLECLWQGKTPNKRIANYAKNVSSDELTTVAAIKRLVLGEESLIDNYAVRCILIGPGGAGKSSLFQLLNQGNVKENIFELAAKAGFKADLKPTVGVHYQNHQPVDLKVHQKLVVDSELKAKSENLQLFLWDFGGQAIFHSLHNAFLHENCVYILVVDSRHEQAPEPWLEQIKALTNNQGQVIVVTNCFDGIAGSQNKTALIRKFPELLDNNSFFSFSCINRKSAGFKAFYNQLLKLSVESTRQLFANTAKAMDVVQQHYLNSPFIDMRGLRALLKREIPQADDERIAELINSLKAFGRYVSVHEDEAQLCLKPEWVINKAYGVINADKTREQNGVVSYDDMADILSALVENDDDKSAQHSSVTELTDRVRDFLVQQKVCIKLKNQHFFLPDAAATTEPAQIKTILQATQHRLAYELDYLPIDTKARIAYDLIAQDVDELNEQIKIWRDGMLLTCEDESDFLLLEYQTRRQRIQITLAGEKLEGQLALLEQMRSTLEEVLGKELLGPIYLEDFCRSASHSMLNDGVRENASAELKKGLKDKSVPFVDKSTHYHFENSTLTDATIGKGNMSKSNNQNSFNSNDKSLMCETLTELLAGKEGEFNQTQIAVLAQALNTLAVADKELPSAADDKANSVITKLWELLKNVDSAASMAERGVKYLAPLLSTFVMSL